ncbi:basic leucine zipper transcriptional factor ATF-like 3 [Gigantopelta aegis]|uniref:basic leucine zipper transcriptional factor ATF-like 3 n=1 Tax=Gigantopelta aegis TaxID=1735272 RepID=UPI001B88C923|nr:basic leucine zipper transcriptional factor ATF-like 3 [Gigantopelta aegis]
MPDSKVDQKLADAAREVLLTGRLTPLIKEELKCKIQSRRLSMGQDEMEVNFEAPKRYQLSDEEKAKKLQRKERNKVAARRHRQKTKEDARKLEKTVEKLENQQKSFLEELDKMTKERKHLLEALSQIHSPPV